MGSFVTFLLLSMCSRFIHVVACTQTSFCFIAEWCSSVQTHHTLFFYSLVYGHLAYFYLLAVVNSAAMNLHVCFCLNTCFQLFWVYISTSWLLSHVVMPCLTYGGLPNYFPKQPHHFINPSATYEGSNSSTSPQTLAIVWFLFVCLFLNFSHQWVRSDNSLQFWFAFP